MSHDYKLARERMVKNQLIPRGIADEHVLRAMGKVQRHLELTGKEKVLEIGTGSGYQTAILAELSDKVYTVERIAPLLERSKSLLQSLGYRNVYFKAYDGTLGWEDFSPFDAIMVTAGAPNIPDPLRKQLADGGRMIIPIGNRYSQDLVRVTRMKDRFVEKNLGGCRFVDLIGEHGWKE
jgi:protein-L-isoaspartate(D-aspartate) O-methyltransferase